MKIIIEIDTDEINSGPGNNSIFLKNVLAIILEEVAIYGEIPLAVAGIKLMNERTLKFNIYVKD